MRAILPTPSRSPLAIGAKLRTSRLAQGLTLADVAETTGLNKGFLSKIERDETSPSIATLVAICEALSLQVGSLFEEPDLQVIPLATAPLINMGGSGVVEKLVSPRSEPGIQMLRSVLSPGATGGKELYTVNCDLEVVHVLSGTFTLRFTSSTMTLATGDTLTIPGREPHTWQNGWEGETEVIWAIVPAAWSGSSV